jgi:hypothetical protein
MKKHYFLKLFFALSLIVAFSQFTSGQNKKILYVGADAILGELRTCDKEMIDSLLSWGYDTIYLGHGVYDAKGAGSGVHSGIDGVFFGESCGSGSVTPYGPSGDNFPVPAIALEAAAFGYSGTDPEDKWALFKPESSTGAADGGGILIHDGEIADAKDNQIKIVDNKHYITEIYEKDQILTWSNSTSYADVPYIHGIRIDNDILAVPVTPVTAPANGDEVSAMMMIENKFPKIKIFWFTNTHSLLNDNMGTNDFYTLMKRAAEYTFDNMPSGVNEDVIEKIGLVAYPNPSAGDVNIRFYALSTSQAQVSLFDITGKQVEVLFDGKVSRGYNFVTMNGDRYQNGAYFIKLQIGEHITYTKILLQ